MKKILAIITVLCLMAVALCITAFAAEPADGTVLRVSALKKGSTDTVVIGDYDNFEDGWNYAMELADDSSRMKVNSYDRVVVDIYADWNATGGEFGSGDGFDSDAIYIPADARVTLNLNGHTVNRGLTEDIGDGEVIFINDDADVIINNGTITGGYSNSEGGGLYIEGGANVTLNDVNIVGNAVKGDDGAAIYIYGGATLVMNGGSISNNSLDEKHLGIDIIEPYGTICAMDAKVILNSVTIDGNYALSNQAKGLILYAKGSIIKMNRCTVSDNLEKGSVMSHAIYVEDSGLTITDTDFTGNNTLPSPAGHSVSLFLFRMKDSSLIMTGGSITQNGGSDLFYLDDTEADITDVTVTDNACDVIILLNSDEVVNMSGCTFGNNTSPESDETFYVNRKDTLILQDCVLGDSTFSNTEYVKITTSEVTREEAVIGIELLREDGTVDSVRYYGDFKSGWSYAIDCVKTGFFDRIVVSHYADWSSREYGAIEIPDNAVMTVNLNGHTVNRGLTASKGDGEVICIGSGAEVTINDGKITGGFSTNGAGGIHINDKANVILNNVHVDGNGVKGDDGAAIAVYSGAALIMNGGSISNNSMDSSVAFGITVSPYGALYVNGSEATLNNVTLSGNYTFEPWAEGVAVYAVKGTVTMSNCIVSDNAVATDKRYNAESVIAGYDSKFIITDTDFTNNASNDMENCYDDSRLFYLEDSRLTMEGGKITQNNPHELFFFNDSDADIGKVAITDNTAVVLNVDNGSQRVNMTECTLGGNTPKDGENDIIVENEDTLVFNNCTLGDTTFDDKNKVEGVGSIFGEGSLTMIVAILALVVSCVSVCVSVVLYKKKTAPAAANGNTGSDSEE